MGSKQSSSDYKVEKKKPSAPLNITGGLVDAEKLLNDPTNQFGVCVGGCAAYAKKTRAQFVSFLDDRLEKFLSTKERCGYNKLVLVAGGNKSKYPKEGVDHGVQRALIEWARGKLDVLCVCILSTEMITFKLHVDPAACGDNVVFLQTHATGSERRMWIGKTAATAEFVFVYAGGPGTVHELQCMVKAGINPSKVFGTGFEYCITCAKNKGHSDVVMLLTRTGESNKGS